MDFMILNIFLGIGWFIRERFPVLQRIFMPSSVVGGIILLICGPQVLGIVPVSSMIGKYPNFLIIIILTETSRKAPAFGRGECVKSHLTSRTSTT